METQKRGQEQDLAKVTHETVKYPDDGAPGLAFFQLLAHHPDATWRGGGNPDSARLQANIPETAVFSEFNCSTFFTSESGRVERRDDLKGRELTGFMVAGSGAFDPGEHIVAVQKTATVGLWHFVSVKSFGLLHTET